MSKSEKRKQEKVISIRVDREIYDRLKKEASDKRRCLGGHVKSMILNVDVIKKYKSVRVPRADEELLRQVLGQLGKVGGNINQIAYQANLSGFDAGVCQALDEWEEEISHIRSLLVKALGVKE